MVVRLALSQHYSWSHRYLEPCAARQVKTTEEARVRYVLVPCCCCPVRIYAVSFHTVIKASTRKQPTKRLVRQVHY